MPKIANRRLSMPQDKLNSMSWPDEQVAKFNIEFDKQYAIRYYGIVNYLYS